MGALGFVTIHEKQPDINAEPTGGANSGAFPPDSDPDLAIVTAAWPTLAGDAKRDILAIVEKARRPG